MSQFYKTPFITATSAPVESYFCDVKRELSKALTADRFVTSHIKLIEGFMKISRSNQVLTHTTTKDDQNDKNNDFNDVLQSNIPDKVMNYENEMDLKSFSAKEYVINSESDCSESTANNSSSIVNDESDDNMQFENWMNLAEKPFQENLTSNKTKIQVKRWPKYKDSCPDIMRFLNKSGLRSTKQALIMNGNLSKRIKIHKKKIIVYNTCAFDALLASTVISYIEFTNYRKSICKESNDNRFLNICQEVARYKSTENTYKERGYILWKIFQHTNVIVDNVHALYTECNLSYLSEKLFKSMPCAIEVHEFLSCSTKNVFENVLVVLEMEDHSDINTNGFKNLQNAMEKYTTKKIIKCRSCNNKKTVHKDLKDHFRVETDWFSMGKEKRGYDGISVSNIPTELLLTDKRYIIYILS